MLNIRTFLIGLRILPKTPLASDTMGELEVDSSTGKLNYFDGTTRSPLATESSTSTLTGKTIAVGSNHITSTANRAAQFNTSTGDLEASTVTDTELGFVSGVTSAIQTQLNGKQATGSYITSLTGDITGSGPGATATTLATVNSNVGSFGSSTSIPSLTVNAKGLVTAASGNVVIAPAGTLTGTTLNSTVVSSSLTSVGTITTGVWNGTAVPVANGGTGQTTANAGFNALSPMTTGGDLIYGGASGVGTRLANGSSGQILTSNGGTSAPSWATASTTGGLTLTNKTTTYTAAISDFVTADASGGAFTVTLPTAVGNTNGRIRVSKTDTTSNNVTINTTSSQTYDGRASGDLKLYRCRDYAEFTSDGANWLINDKVETQVLSKQADGTISFSGRTSGDYLTSSATVTLGIGKWRLRGYFSLNTGSGTATSLITPTGLYSADGANTGTQPALLGSGTNVKQVDGDALTDAYCSTSPVTAAASNNNQRYPAGFVEVVITIAGGTQAVYAVPRIDFSTTGTATTVPYIRAERIW